MSGHSGMIVQKRMSFLASCVWAVASILITGIVSVAGISLYGLRIIDQRVGNALQLVPAVLEGLDNLPPMLADAIDQRRQPDYREQLAVDVAFSPAGSNEDSQPLLTVENNGDKTVGFLAVRVVVRDPRGRIVHEGTTNVATPVAVEGYREMPGPILPGAKRQITTGWVAGSEGLSAEIEITDVFVGPASRPQSST